MMGFLRKKDRAVATATDALRNTAGAGTSLISWRSALTWFARALALLWLMKGLSAWAIILDILGHGPEFSLRPVGYQSLIIYFAVVDLVAAVGLWMVAAWGGVVWILAVVSYVVISALPERLIPAVPWWISVVLGLFMVMYLALRWLAMRESMSRR